MKGIGFWVWVGVTVAYVVGILVLWGGKIWALAPNEVGDFLAGVFTPAAFLWLIIGYFMQQKELSLQREELRHQREELTLTRDKLGEQVKLSSEQVEADRQRSLPILHLRSNSNDSETQQWVIRNIGEGSAKEVILTKVDLDGKNRNSVARERVLLTAQDPEDFLPFTTPRPNPGSFHIEAQFQSNSSERLYQRWRINSDDGHEELTNGPEPLEG